MTPRTIRPTRPSAAGSWRRRTGAAMSIGMIAGLVYVVPMTGVAGAAVLEPAPTCESGVCTVTYSAADAELQTFTVPGGVTSLKATVEGAQGGNGFFWSEENTGRGGRTVGEVPVEENSVLTLLVGTVGWSGAFNSGQGPGSPGGVGGGGTSGGTSNAGGPVHAGGGGGSFVYGPAGETLLAAGGGGGQSEFMGGGGGTATADGQAGEDPSGQPGKSGRGAGAAPGTPGTGGGAGAGQAGAGTSTPFGVGVGGAGGESQFHWAPSGAGGGGGYNGGGGGGDNGGAGGGGGGYAAPGVTADADASAVGIRTGDGEITLSWADPDAPVIAAHNNLTAEATGAAGAVVAYSPPTATDRTAGQLPVSCTPASGSTFPIGGTTVTCTATDSEGNIATSTFRVTVTDTIAPVIAAHDDLTAEATGAAGAAVTYAPPNATDIVDGTVAVTCAPPSGTTFPVGTTMISCSAVDRAGNHATRSFTVTVTPKPTADVAVVLTGPATAKAGSRVTFTLKVTNNGSLTATSLTSALKTSGLTAVTASAGGVTTTTGTGAATKTGTTWTMPSIAVGQTVTLTVKGTVAVKKGQSVTVLGAAFSLVADPDALNNVTFLALKAS